MRGHIIICMNNIFLDAFKLLVAKAIPETQAEKVCIHIIPILLKVHNL